MRGEGRVYEIRIAGGEALGRKLNQQEAGELVGAAPRSWYFWERNSKQMSATTLELFCLKTGLEYHPDLLESDRPISKSRKANLTLVPQLSSSQFLTLTNVEDHLTVTINSATIKKYKLNRKTSGTTIELITGEILEVEQTTGKIDSALDAKMLADEMFSFSAD